MKEGVKSLIIEPSSEYIDFISPDSSNTNDYQIFKGNIRLTTTKSIKIKSVSVNFIGESILFNPTEISTPILPKLKAKLQYKASIVPTGEHLLPWEIGIPNIYPMSYSNKRSVIRYKLQIKISLGITNKPIIADRAIIIKRHMLPSQELAALVSTKTFENTLANGFHYCIKVPRIVCLEQGYFPISLKYDYLDRSKKQLVDFIFTRITQIEVYRCRSIARSDADMANKKASGQTLYDLYKLGDPGLNRLQRLSRTTTINEIDKSSEDYSTIPLLLKQDLDTSFSHKLESPLVAISHQFEVIFHLIHADEIRVKFPILVSSVPDSRFAEGNPPSIVQKYTLETELHKVPFSVEKSESPALKRNTIDEAAINCIRQKSLKRSVSDQELKEEREGKHQSIMSSPSHRQSQYTDDSTFDSRSTDSSTHSPTFSTFSSNDLSSSPKQDVAFTALRPPPRHVKKKDATTFTPFPSPTLPLPPIPDKKRLQHSKSANTSSTVFIKTKRSNSIDHQMIPKCIDKEKMLDIPIYSSSVTHRYESAKLPPIPPPVPRNKLPSIATEAHRMTRMYYDDEDDSDEEE